MGAHQRLMACMVMLLVVALNGCSEQQLARGTSDWCRLNPDCEHYGDTTDDRLPSSD